MARISITTDSGEVVEILNVGPDDIGSQLARASLTIDVIEAVERAHQQETGQEIGQ